MAVFGFIYLVNAAAPEIMGSDTLGLAMREWQAKRLLAFPDGMRMLFLLAFTFGRHSAAALTHFLFLLALPLLMVCYGRPARIARRGGGAGRAAGLPEPAGGAGRHRGAREHRAGGDPVRGLLSVRTGRALGVAAGRGPAVSR